MCWSEQQEEITEWIFVANLIGHQLDFIKEQADESHKYEKVSPSSAYTRKSTEATEGKENSFFMSSWFDQGVPVACISSVQCALPVASTCCSSRCFASTTSCDMHMKPTTHQGNFCWMTQQKKFGWSKKRKAFSWFLCCLCQDSKKRITFFRVAVGLGGAKIVGPPTTPMRK